MCELRAKKTYSMLGHALAPENYKSMCVRLSLCSDDVEIQSQLRSVTNSFVNRSWPISVPLCIHTPMLYI